MLQFAKGVPLGEKGLDRLKIHLVTLHGAQKKASLDERLQYANNLMEDVLDSANNPLTVGNLKRLFPLMMAPSILLNMVDITGKPIMLHGSCLCSTASERCMSNNAYPNCKSGQRV